MPSLLQQTKRLLARNPTATSFGIAAVGLTALIVLSVAMVGRSALSDADADFVRGEILMRQQTEEIEQTFSALERIAPPYCSQSTLAILNGYLFSSKFVRDIGFYDDEGRIFCTVSRGLLPHPLPSYSNPSLIQGDLFWSSASPPIADNRSNSVIIKRGDRFEVVLHPDAVKSTHQYFSVLWSLDSATPYYIAPGLTASLVEAAVKRKNTKNQDWIFDTSEWTLLSVRSVNNRITAAIAIPLFKAIDYQRAIFPLFFIIAIAFTWTLKKVLDNIFKKWGTLEYRLPSILIPENIICHYQPIIQLNGEKIVGCEVLMRLRDEEGLVAPNIIIPLIEKNGLHKAFDNAVLNKAVQELPLLMDKVSSFEVAFNLFPASIDSKSLSAHFSILATTLKQRKIKICFEITEYHFSESAIPALQRLRNAGFAISVDDFGTGYSNLNIVKRLSPDHLKIDRSFVYDMEDSTIRSSLIPEIVRISKAVGAMTVAEGIENIEQAKQLRDHGVDYGQGYYFGKPMPLADLIALLQAQPERGLCNGSHPAT